MITIFNRKRKIAEIELFLAKNELKQLKNDIRTHYINNLPKYPQEVSIEFHIGAKKQVYFDGKNFIKDDKTPYRIGSIKLWREL